MDRHSDFFLLRVIAADNVPTATVAWYGFDSDNRLVASGHGSLQQLPACTELEIVIPATHVAAHLVALPPNAGRYSGQILAQALEDRLLEKLDGVHYVQGQRLGDHVQIWVIARDWLRTLLATLAEAGRPPSRVIAEYECLPTEPEAVYAEANGYLYFRSPDQHYACVDSASTLALLHPEQHFEQIESPLTHRPVHTPTNLLSGSFGAKPASSLKLSSFRRSLILACVLLLLLLVQHILQWQSLAKRELHLQQEIRQTFAALFPGTPIIDPILQWQSRQSDSLSSNTHKDALLLANRIAADMQARIRPRSLDVRDGVLRLTIAEAQANTARAALEKMALQVEASPAEGGTVRLVVRPKH